MEVAMNGNSARVNIAYPAVIILVYPVAADVRDMPDRFVMPGTAAASVRRGPA